MTVGEDSLCWSQLVYSGTQKGHGLVMVRFRKMKTLGWITSLVVFDVAIGAVLAEPKQALQSPYSQSTNTHRVTVLSIERGIAFFDKKRVLDTQLHRHGPHPAEWMQIKLLVEPLDGVFAHYEFRGETATPDGSPVKKATMIEIERNGESYEIESSSSSTSAYMLRGSPTLRDRLYPVEIPTETSERSQVLIYEISGKLFDGERFRFELAFRNRRDEQSTWQQVKFDLPMP